jgi:hypothetical protein
MRVTPVLKKTALSRLKQGISFSPYGLEFVNG